MGFISVWRWCVVDSFWLGVWINWGRVSKVSFGMQGGFSVSFGTKVLWFCFHVPVEKISPPNHSPFQTFQLHGQRILANPLVRRVKMMQARQTTSVKDQPKEILTNQAERAGVFCNGFQFVRLLVFPLFRQTLWRQITLLTRTMQNAVWQSGRSCQEKFRRNSAANLCGNKSLQWGFLLND